MDRSAKKIGDFIRKFSRRADVRVVTSELRPPAPAEALESARGKIPGELLSFYAAMNGVHFAWAFVEPPGGGCIQIPPLDAHQRFATDEVQHTAFGEGRRSLLLDCIEPECATWYLLGGGGVPDEAVLWFSSSSGVSGGRLVARSLAEYVDLAIAHACVSWWPAPSGDIPAWIARAQAAPVKPGPIRIGARIETSYYSEHARGVVQEVHPVSLPEHSLLRSYGDRYALVALDEGATAWLPFTSIKAVRAKDVYEEALTRGDAFWEALEALPMLERIAQVARAIGPVEGYSATWGGPSNTRRAAGLLSPLSLARTVERIATLFGDAARAVPTLAELHPLPKTGGEFAVSAWKARGFRFVPRDALDGLLSGFARRISRASAAARVAPRALLPEHTEVALRWVPGRAHLQALLAQEGPAAAPELRVDAESTRAELGLPGVHGVGLGNGF
ncbi:hypothetical protein [Chondromyces apiculatus]|uniref:Uncharacterized protein n=1 Tax=Chondromyces apiculatus DSM 436 TaxID=1192034 RepID=A0A017TFP4_9BACT|nr:hypothetical protein [Chondromyces apiculatus]EYF07640.1 Hypothetical protein CAP_8141 [Chondromyces apiculatus DSM 436]